MDEPKKKKQVLRFDDKEMALIKATFSDNEPLLKSMRKVFLQMPLNAVDLSQLELTFNGKTELQKVIRKNFLPEIEADVPLGQQIDFWLTIGLKDMMPDVAPFHLKAIKIWIDYFDQQLELLESGDYGTIGKIKLKGLADIVGKDNDQMYINMLARNTIITSTEQQLMQLLFLAGNKDETPEQTAERLKRDSSK